MVTRRPSQSMRACLDDTTSAWSAITLPGDRPTVMPAVRTYCTSTGVPASSKAWMHGTFGRAACQWGRRPRRGGSSPRRGREKGGRLRFDVHDLGLRTAGIGCAQGRGWRRSCRSEERVQGLRELATRRETSLRMGRKTPHDDALELFGNARGEAAQQRQIGRIEDRPLTAVTKRRTPSRQLVERARRARRDLASDPTSTSDRGERHWRHRREGRTHPRPGAGRDRTL